MRWVREREESGVAFIHSPFMLYLALGTQHPACGALCTEFSGCGKVYRDVEAQEKCGKPFLIHIEFHFSIGIYFFSPFSLHFAEMSK